MSSASSLDHVVVIVPTYNEAPNVVVMLDALREVDAELERYRFSFLVVDDESPDGTARLVSEYAETHTSVSLLSRPREGLGRAMRAGYAHAIGVLEADVVVALDCDFQWNPRDVPRLLAEIERGSDVVVGSRHTRLGEIEGWPRGRGATHWVANTLFATFVAGTREVLDHNGNFRAVRVRGAVAERSDN